MRDIPTIIATRLMAQTGYMLPWAPVCLGVGICVFFMATTEPSGGLLWVCAALCAVGFALSWRFAGEVWTPLARALALVAAGVALAGWRTHSVAAPVLEWRYYGPVEGRVVGLDRSASDAVRVTLEDVILSRMSPERTPVRVRISLHGDAAQDPPPIPGARVMTTAHLAPPSGPVEPGGFDFQRHSWFLKLGAVGYTRVPLLLAAPPDRTSWRSWVFETRMAVSRAMRSALPGDIGGFAAAITSGDRSGMSQDALRDLRASNLAHLLAISGLHMGLLTGTIYGALRFALVVIPTVALYWPVRRIAAIGAWFAASGYLALSGGNVSTERAYIMVSVALLAVCLDRRAFSLRAVAIAALVVLFLRPEALLGPGFQMSFAATTALVVVFNVMRDAPWQVPKILRGPFGVFVSSLVAGLATAPIAAAHFNAFAHYGLFANLASVPVMGILVVPALLVSSLLAFVGLADLGLWVMGLGLQWILWVAEVTANLPGARSFVVSPSLWVLPCIVLGALIVAIWQGRERFAGALLLALGFALWQSNTCPDVLIADNGSLVGILTEQGRAVSRARSARFVARNWLENDGDMSAQEVSHALWGAAFPERVEHPGVAARGVFSGRPLWHLTGKRSSADLPACNGAIIVTNQRLDPVAQPGCLIYDARALRDTGAIALSLEPDGRIRTTTARQMAGDRVWSNWPDQRNRSSDMGDQ